METVDQHQRLLRINPSIAHTLAAPAAGIDQPAGGQLDGAVRHRIVHDVRIATDDVVALFARNHRILEEAAHVAHLGRVRQLGATDRHHHVEHLLCRGPGDAPFGHLALDVQIADFGTPLLGQRKAHLRDHRLAGQTALALLLENGIAVGETALRGIQRKRAARGQLDRIQAVKTVLQLDAIGPDVLHRGRAHGAGNQCQVFQSRVTLLQGPGDKVMPDFAGTRLHDPVAIGFLHQGPSLNLHLDHQGQQVTGDHHIAAATQHQVAALQLARLLGQGLQVGRLTHAQQAVCTRCNAQRVVGIEGNVVFDTEDGHGG